MSSCDSLFLQLIQFLITLARSNRVLGVKRKMQVHLRLKHSDWSTFISVTVFLL